MKKKLLILTLSIIFVSTPVISNAQTTESLLQQISQLLATVESLQQKLSKLKETPNTQTTQTPTKTSYCAPIGTKFGFGISGAQVTKLQNFLKTTGDYSSTPTGIYDSLTTKAVQKYQCREMQICSGTPSTNGYGTAGPGTRSNMCKRKGVAPIIQTTTVTQPPTATIAPNLTRNLWLGLKGEDVKQLQMFLKTTGDFTYPEITGYYGQVTVKAVQKYQCRELSICSGSQSSNGYGATGPRTRKAFTREVGKPTTTVPSVSTGGGGGSTAMPVYSWRLSNWGKCLNSTQVRTVDCVGTNSNVYADSKCSTIKPVISKACSPTPSSPKSCTFNNQTVASGSSVTAYQASTVAYGEVCQQETRACSNGVLSGEYSNATCAVQSATIVSNLTQTQQDLVDKWVGWGDIFVTQLNGRDINYNQWSGEAWGIAGYGVEGLLNIYEGSEDKGLLDKVIEIEDIMFTKRESQLDQIKDTDCVYTGVTTDTPAWITFVDQRAVDASGGSLNRVDCWEISTVHQGMILRPIARFIRVARSLPNNSENTIYKSKADEYLEYIRELIDYMEQSQADGGQETLYSYVYSGDNKKYGYVKYGPNWNESGVNEANENRVDIMAPLNFTAVFASTFIELRDEGKFYADRALWYTRTLNDIVKRTGGLGTWIYWPGYVPGINNIDDVSHGGLVSDAIVRAWIARIDAVNTDAVLNDIANNFKTNTVLYDNNNNPVHLATDIDGTVYNDEYLDTSCGMWLRVADYDSTITNICEQINKWKESTYETSIDAAYNMAEAQLFRIKMK